MSAKSHADQKHARVQPANRCEIDITRYLLHHTAAPQLHGEKVQSQCRLLRLFFFGLRLGQFQELGQYCQELCRAQAHARITKSFTYMARLTIRVIGTACLVLVCGCYTAAAVAIP